MRASSFTVLLACFGMSAAQCTTASYDPTPDRPRSPLPLAPIHSSYTQYNINIPAEETCQTLNPGSQPVAVDTTVCSTNPPATLAPQVYSQGLYSTEVVAYSSTVAYVTVYCSVLSHSGHVALKHDAGHLLGLQNWNGNA